MEDPTEQPEHGDPPYREHLDRLPEEVRDQVEPVFKDWDAGTTKRFQEAAEYKRGWEPFERLGVNSRDPAEVEWALQFVDAQRSNPQAVQEWFDEYAQEHGLKAAQAAVEEYVDPAVSSHLEQQLKAQLGPVARQLEELASWKQEREKQEREAQAMSEIRSEMDELKSKHGDEFNEPIVKKLIANYIKSDPGNAVQLAFADWQSIRSQIEKETLQAKADVPAGAVSGGTADGHVEPAKTLADAAAQALEQLRGNRQ